ncbi:MAG: DUF421 domain-containing protein [Firmicutes bacterium]|nr:DUF421 domain-containing protein [Bacillota bacterium]
MRALGSFIFLFVLTRLMGKEQIAQLTFFDYIVGITIGSIAATLTTTPQDPFLPGLLGLVIWGLLPILIGLITLKWVPIRKIMEGEPVVIIQNGKIDEEVMTKQRLNYDDLLMLLREQKVFNIHDVENALYERDGQLSIQLKSQQQPATPKDLNLSTQYKGLPTTIIEDGIILTNRLKEVSLSKDWLLKKLQREHGIKNANEVSIAQLDTGGNLYVDIINANPENKTK